MNRDRSRKKEILSESVERKLKLKKGLIKYKPEGRESQMPNNKDMTTEEAETKKKAIGNSILIQTNVKGNLHELFNSIIIHELPLSQKHIYKFERESTGKFFFNITNLEFDIMTRIESKLRNTEMFLNGLFTIKIASQYSKLKNTNEINTKANLSEEDLDYLIERNNLEVLEFPKDESINVNQSWEQKTDSKTDNLFFFNPYLQECLLELPLGASLKINQVDNFDQLQKQKIIWTQINNKKLTLWMKRPAREQVTEQRQTTSYVEGHYDYNIWYDKYLSDRKEDKSQIASLYKCNPELDTGYTRADIQEKQGLAYFCLFFAKGYCGFGANCRYYHRIPTLEDCEYIENMKDIFGRPRHAIHKQDKSGVGVFTKECRTLFITNLKLLKTGNTQKNMMKYIYLNFSTFGSVEDISLLYEKAAAFIKFAHRCQAEFAKEAMTGQCIIGSEVIMIKWAIDEELEEKHKDQINKEQKYKFESMVKNEKLTNSITNNYGYSHENNQIMINSINKDIPQANNSILSNNTYQLQFEETMKQIEQLKKQNN